MSASVLAATMLSIMLAKAPPGRSHIVEARETVEAGAARYGEIAEAIADVSGGNARTAALLLAVSFHESGWRRDVDLGRGKLARGSGRDSCLMQVRVTTDEHRALTADRRRCFRLGLERLQRSLNACRHLPRLDRLAAYASGACDRGRLESRARMKTADDFEARIRAVL